MTAPDRALFERNLAAFAESYPAVHHRLAAIETPRAKIVGSVAAGDLNLDLGHTLLYGTDAVSFTTGQLAAFRADPARFYMDPPIRYEQPPQHQYHVTNALYRHLAGRDISVLPVASTQDAGYCLIYGIGLGFHLPDLFDELTVEHFIIMEEFPEFLWHSLWLQDWAGMIERLRDRGTRLRFIFGNEGGNIADECHWYMRGAGFGLIDGSYVYRHYHSLVLDAAHAEFRKNLPLLPISIGFFEDEIVMVRNCGTNLLDCRYRLLDGRPRLEKDVPVIIVGSGPSFDASLDHLRALRDKAILFSCGTGLSALLRNGLRPDFHCELENVYGSYEQLRRLRDQYGPLDDIILIASNTVHPLTPTLFERRVFFFRDSVASTAFWAPDQIGLYGMAPTVTNLGLRAALLMCFRNIYLFGVDMGTRDATRHHSDAAIYATDTEWVKQYGGAPRGMTIPMPANFGGEAWTNDVLHWARMLMIQTIGAFSVAKIYNCSDGVKIDGTIPRLPRTVSIDTPSGRKRIVIERLMAEMEEHVPGSMVDIDAIRELRAELEDWADDYLALIARTRADCRNFVDFYREALPFLATNGARKHQYTIRAIYIGVLMMAYQIGYFFARRVDGDEFPALMGAYLDALEERLAVMRADIDQEFATLQAKAEALQAASAA